MSVEFNKLYQGKSDAKEKNIVFAIVLVYLTSKRKPGKEVITTEALTTLFQDLAAQESQVHVILSKRVGHENNSRQST